MPGQVLYPVSPYPARPKGIEEDDGSSSGGGGGGLIQPKTNNPTVTTGVDKDGNLTLDSTPASIGGGFFGRLMAGRQGRNNINTINANLAQAMIEAKGRLANTRQTGIEERKTKITDAQLVTLQKAGLIPRTDKDGNTIDAKLINDYAAQTDKPRLAAAGNNAQADESVSAKQLDTTKSGRGQKAVEDSTLGQLLGPALAAQKASQVSAAPGETVAFNSFNDLMNSKPDLLKGALTSSQSFAPTQVPTKDARGNITGFDVKPMQTGNMSMQGGGLQMQPPSIPPELMQQAMTMQQPQQPASPVSPYPNTDMITNMSMNGQLGNATLSPSSMIPSKPLPANDPVTGISNNITPSMGDEWIKSFMQYLGSKQQQSIPAQTTGGLGF